MGDEVRLARRLQYSAAMLSHSPVMSRVIGHAIAVHRALGPGLLESTYEHCLMFCLCRDRLRYERQVAMPVVFEGVRVECGYRIDLVVEGEVIVELKSARHLLPIHSAQVLTYLKLSGLPYGVLFNFNVTKLVDGMKTFVNPLRAARSPDDQRL